MVDVSLQIFAIVAQELRDKFSGVRVEGAFNNTPSSFPFVSVEEIENTSHSPTRDSGSTENHANITYEINAYSNEVNGKTIQAKAMIMCADEVMAELGFTRTFGQPTPNTANATIARYTARYVAVIDTQTETIYRR